MNTPIPLIERLRELSQLAEPEVLPDLCRRLADATHRCEVLLGHQPKSWNFMYGLVPEDGKKPSRSPEVTAFLESLPSSSLRHFLNVFATWEEFGRPELNPFEPLVEICRHGGSMSRAGDGLLDLKDHTGDGMGIPIASTFRKEFREIA